MLHNFSCLVKRKTLDQLNFIKFNFAKNSSQIGTPQKPNKFRETPGLPHSWVIFIVQKEKKKACSLETAQLVTAGVSALFEQL